MDDQESLRDFYRAINRDIDAESLKDVWKITPDVVKEATHHLKPKKTTLSSILHLIASRMLHISCLKDFVPYFDFSLYMDMCQRY